MVPGFIPVPPRRPPPPCADRLVGPEHLASAERPACGGERLIHRHVRILVQRGGESPDVPKARVPADPIEATTGFVVFGGCRTEAYRIKELYP
jgi:hypothetical protein